MTRHAAVVGYALALACTLAPVAAHASPVEQLVDVAFGPGAAPVIVARYANGGDGLIYGTDRGHSYSWRLQCGSAFLGPNETGIGPPLILADGTLLLATSRGIVAGKVDGCGFHREALEEGELVSELVADPTDANAAFALVRTTLNSRSSTTLRRRSAEGVWAAFGATDDRLGVSVRIAAHEDRLRIYEVVLLAVQDDDAGAPFYVYKLRYSDDGASSFHELPLPGEGEPRVIGIDPTNPDHVAVLVRRSGAADSILISRDRGATLTPYLELGEYGGLAWAADGRLWIGGSSDGSATAHGVWAAPNLDSPPVRLASADYAVQCLAYHAPSDTLYACQHFWLGVVEATSGAFAKTLSFTTVEDFVSCEGSDAAASCEGQLCSAYCGAGHFAVAPVCAAYDELGCGVPVARQESGETQAPAAMDTAPEPSDAAATEKTDAGAAASAPTAVTHDAQSASAPSDASSGSCAVVRARGVPANAPWSALVAAFAALAWRASQRRGRKAGHSS